MMGAKDIAKICGQMRHRMPCRVNLNSYNGVCPLVHDSSKMIEVNSEFEQAVLVELADIHAGIAKIMEKLNTLQPQPFFRSYPSGAPVVNEYGLPIDSRAVVPATVSAEQVFTPWQEAKEPDAIDAALAVLTRDVVPVPEKAEDGTPIILDPTALKPAAPQMDVWACPACTKPGTRAPLMDAKDPKKRPMYHCKECPCYFPGEQAEVREPGRPVRKADFDDTGEGKIIRPLK